jgi:hypothetical protein
MSVVEPQLDYLPTNWTTVSGGIGVFDSSLSVQLIAGPAFTNLVYSALQDPRFSSLSDPVTEECRSSPVCTSSIVSGGLRTISPFPYLLKNLELPAYIAKDVPAYQIDAWDLSDTTIDYIGKECQLYRARGGVFNGIYICAKNQPDGSIVAAMSTCLTNCVPLTDLQNSPFQTMSWATRLVIHRRLVTFTADRRTELIVSVSDLSPPILQTIPASDFRPAFASLLCEETSKSSLCEQLGPNTLFTDSVASMAAVTVNSNAFSPALGILQNLFATSLYLFTPVFIRQTQVDAVALSNITIDGLSEENYFQASLAKPYEYVAPAPWTSLAYLVSGLVLVVLCSSAIALSSVIGTPEVSNFPGVDAMRLRVEDRHGAEQAGGMAGVFDVQQKDSEVMRTAIGLVVRLEGQGPGVSAAAP